MRVLAEMREKEYEEWDTTSPGFEDPAWGTGINQIRVGP